MRRYMFVLAERLGMTVAELGRRMSARELSEWLVFDKLSRPDPGGAPAGPAALRAEMDNRALAALNKMQRNRGRY